MKRVGIITFHRSHNCGSIMQSYATQEVLKKYGFQPEFIDFSTQGQKELYLVFSEKLCKKCVQKRTWSDFV